MENIDHIIKSGMRNRFIAVATVCYKYTYKQVGNTFGISGTRVRAITKNETKKALYMRSTLFERYDDITYLRRFPNRMKTLLGWKGGSE